MPRKSNESASEDTPVLRLFQYPTIGNGVTIEAKDQEEADAKAAKLIEDMKSAS